MPDYLITMFATTPRRIRVVEGVIAGKRTVTNLFWGRLYGLLPYLGADRHLRREAYDAWLAQTTQAGLLTTGDGYAQLTPAGERAKEDYLAAHYQPRFGEWTWLVNPFRLASRVLLAVQVTSEFAHHSRHYAPLNTDFATQRAVRNWFVRQGPGLAGDLREELTVALTQLAQADERLANLFAYRLIGHQTVGWTDQTAASNLGVPADDLFWLERDAWLFLAHALTTSPGPLAELARPLLATSPVTRSVQQTVAMSRAGLSPAEISRRRHLKVSTVREHLLQALILTPGALSVDQLLPAPVEQRLREQVSGDPLSWRFEASGPNAAEEYYYFRLFQIKEGLR